MSASPSLQIPAIANATSSLDRESRYFKRTLTACGKNAQAELSGFRTQRPACRPCRRRAFHPCRSGSAECGHLRDCVKNEIARYGLKCRLEDAEAEKRGECRGYGDGELGTCFLRGRKNFKPKG